MFEVSLCAELPLNPLHYGFAGGIRRRPYRRRAGHLHRRAAAHHGLVPGARQRVFASDLLLLLRVHARRLRLCTCLE